MFLILHISRYHLLMLRKEELRSRYYIEYLLTFLLCHQIDKEMNVQSTANIPKTNKE